MFIDDIFWLWTSSKQEISHFIDFAKRFHATLKSKCENILPLATIYNPSVPETQRDPYDELVFYP